VRVFLLLHAPHDPPHGPHARRHHFVRLAPNTVSLLVAFHACHAPPQTILLASLYAARFTSWSAYVDINERFIRARALVLLRFRCETG
jgi:hypothetical protein